MNEKRQPVQLKDINTLESASSLHSKNIHASLFKVIAAGNLDNIKNLISLYHNTQGFKINVATQIHEVLEPNDANYIVFVPSCWTLKWTFLFVAIFKGFPDIVTYLLKTFSKDIDINAKDAEGYTALHRACLYGGETLVKLLLEHGADPTITNNEYYSPLHAASGKGHSDIVLRLCQIPEVNVDVRNKHGVTPLILAAQNNKMECCEILLQYNADPNIPTYAGHTPLHIAAGNNLHNICHLLLKSKADIYAVDSERRTPFHVATFETKMLIQNWKMQSLVVRVFEDVKTRMDTLTNSLKLVESKGILGTNLLESVFSRLDTIDQQLHYRSTPQSNFQPSVHDMSIDESPTKKRASVLDLTIIEENNKKLFEVQFDRHPSYDMLLLEIAKTLRVDKERIKNISKWTIDNECIDEDRVQRLKSKDVLSVALK